MPRIIIKVGAKDLEEVMSNLEKDQNFSDQAEYTLEVGIKDTKNNYQYLINSPKVLEWDFLVEEKENIEENPEFKRDELDEIFRYFINDNNFRNHSLYDFDRLSYLVEIVYNLKKKSPSFRFTLNNLFQIKNTTTIDIETETIIQLRNKYSDLGYRDALRDLIINIYSKWNKLESNFKCSSDLVLFILS